MEQQLFKNVPPQTVSSYGINRVKSLKWSLQIDPIYSKRNILKRPSLFSFVNFNPPLLYIPSHVKSSLISVSIPHYNHRPTSDPMLIRLFPLYDYYYCSVYSFCIFYRPGLTIPRNLKYAFFSHNNCVDTWNHCVSQFTWKQYWKTTFRAPCLSGFPPPNQHKQPLCGYTEPLCESIHLKTLQENNF